MSSGSESGNQMAGFLNLPAELRNKIYENSVLHREKAGKRTQLSITDFRARHQEIMSLMLADKQIGGEILPMFFGDNVLHLGDRRSKCPNKPTVFFADGDTLEQGDRRILVHYSTPECTLCPNDITHRVLGGRKIELPPLKWRHLFKHVKLNLHAPRRQRLLLAVFRAYAKPDRHATEDRHMWYHQDVDWLYPVHKLTALRFDKLYYLDIEVQPEELHPTSYEIETLETWLKEKINGMQIDAMEIRVSLKCRRRRAQTFLRL